MGCHTYVEKNFSKKSRAVISVANKIIKEYQDQGFQLTLRQLYYQFVARDIVPNNIKVYKMIGSIINDARLAGEVDWKAIIDRTRELRGRQQWESPKEILEATANSYHIDHWKGQECVPEVWIEKDALIGVFEGVCEKMDVSYFSCRGYTSQSEMWEASQRILRRFEDGQRTKILHFGDHDPSGVDMSRDILDRLSMFTEGEDCFDFMRVALHMEQIEKYKLPPNPAKLTDSRSGPYIEKHGNESWELDALDPKILAAFAKYFIEKCVDDQAARGKAIAQEALDQMKIRRAAKKLEK